MKALVLADIDRRIEREFSQVIFEYKGYAVGNHIPIEHSELKNIIHEYDFLISEFDTIDKEIIYAATKLKMIICCRGGVNSVVDVVYASRKGIIVRNTPARNANAVAEYVLGIIINADRKLAKANTNVLDDTLQNQDFFLPKEYRDSLWGMDSKSPYHSFRGKGLSNITLGIIGYGNIGRTVANMANLLGINVLVYNHHPIISPVPAGIDVVDYDFLLKNSDYISLHCSNREKKILISKSDFLKMKQGAYFINTARGNLVDEEALIEALEVEHLSGAALDVTTQEPLPPNSPLIKAKNIFLTPHIAGAADEVIQIGTDMVIYHLRNFLYDNWEA